MHILVIDDHALFRCGLQMLLGQLVSNMHVYEAADTRTAIDLITSGIPFDLVLTDWYMDGLSGGETIERLRDALPQGRIVVVSGDRSPNLIRTCIQKGAAGFIAKDESPANLLHALSTITRGGIYLPPESPAAHLAPSSPSRYMLANVADCFTELTPRQCEVLCAMARGHSNKVIARNLGISEDTVKQHLAVVYGVLAVHSRTEAVYALAKRGVKVE